MEVRRVTDPGELAIAVDILEEAARWMRQRSGGGWDVGQFHEEVANDGRLAQAFGDGDLYLAWDEDRPVATMTLQWQDQLFWPDAVDDAGYVHRLAVATDAHGRGIGRALLRWAESEAASRGKPFLRLDTSAENPVLRRYYEDAGFVLKSRGVVGSWSVVLYERGVPPARLRADQAEEPPNRPSKNSSRPCCHRIATHASAG